MQTIHADKTVSVTELKRNFSAILDQAEGCPVAVLNHNRPEAYLLPAACYEKILERLEDMEDARLVNQRANGPFVDVTLDAL